MGNKLQKNTMICPCCGEERLIAAIECLSCGARQVGPPLAPPDRLLPNMGPAMSALAVAILVVIVFLAVWIFSSDMKVGRAMMVAILGDGTRLTRSMIAADPRLPYYRIFAYDAVRQAFYLSIVLIPLSLLGVRLAGRARRLATGAPNLFGGVGMARAAMIMSSSLLVLFTTITAFSLPEAFERGRAKKRAATRSVMYQLHQQALHKYYNEYGSYPQDLADLSRIKAENSPKLDYWEQPFTYTPVGEIASNGSAVSLTTYKLVSAGADGKIGTADDLTMIDGVVQEGRVDENSPLSGIIR